LWLVTDYPKLSEVSEGIFLDRGNELLSSAVIGFEIAVTKPLESKAIV
jgi:hypothetical protein